MPEINLPTATKQDAILSSVENITHDVRGGNYVGEDILTAEVGIVNNSDVYNELFKVEGKGKIEHLFIKGYREAKANIKIYADGVLVIEKTLTPSTNNEAYYYFCVLENSLFDGSVGNIYSLIAKEPIALKGGVNRVADFSKQGLFFRESLIVSANYTTLGGKIYYQLL